MLGNIRKFSKSIFAKILLVIIIIPFIFWGMGGVFSGGNTNSVAKINDHNISTQDFMDYLNNSRIDQKVIRENIDKKILEQMLSELVSITLLNMEIDDLDITVSEKSLAQIIKNNKDFLDEKGSFSRTEYEKFLLLQNLTAIQYEQQLKKNELRKKLFSYVSGGVKSPLFVTNNIYKEKTAKLDIEYINLQKLYKKKEKFNSNEVKEYIKKNSEDLKEEYIDFSYAKISPKDLTGSDDFNELFFKKIDELENKISNEVEFNEIVRDIKIKPIKKIKFRPDNKENDIEIKIYQKRNESKIQLIDMNEFYVIFEIENINRSLPSAENQIFFNKIQKLLYEKNKFDFNKDIFDRIINKKFTNTDFANLGKNNSIDIIKYKLKSIGDDKKFDINSVELLYSQPINTFALVSDKKNNIFLTKINKITKKDITQSSNDFEIFNTQANIKIKDTMYKSYDYYIAEKYDVKINEKTLERIKNYFK